MEKQSFISKASLNRQDEQSFHSKIQQKLKVKGTVSIEKHHNIVVNSKVSIKKLTEIQSEMQSVHTKAS